MKKLKRKMKNEKVKMPLPTRQWAGRRAGRRAKLKMFFVVGEFTRLKQSKLCHYIFKFSEIIGYRDLRLGI